MKTIQWIKLNDTYVAMNGKSQLVGYCPELKRPPSALFKPSKKSAV